MQLLKLRGTICMRSTLVVDMALDQRNYFARILETRSTVISFARVIEVCPYNFDIPGPTHDRTESPRRPPLPCTVVDISKRFLIVLFAYKAK